ncbi:hypothetical protein SVIOM342S_02755 [Streptomyces violaceorubidus]
MPNCTSSGVASSTSLNACFAAAMRVPPSMSRVRIEPLTSSTRSTFGASSPVGSPALAPAGNAVPAASAASRAQAPAASRVLVIIGGSY